ncbi:hypothetical protein EJB05_10167, partial [Eragrostis curvula]
MDQRELLHGNGKKPIGAFRRRYCSTTAVTLLLFLLTNTVSILVSSGAGPSLLRRYKPGTIRLWDDSAALLADLNATQAALATGRAELLAAGRAELAGLYARIGTANELLRTLRGSNNKWPPATSTGGRAILPASSSWPAPRTGCQPAALPARRRRSSQLWATRAAACRTTWSSGT